MTGLGRGTSSGGSLIPDLAAGTGGSAGKRRDGRRMVVRLHLGHQVNNLIDAPVAGIRIGSDQFPPRRAFDHGRIVLVGHHATLRVLVIGIANHVEERMPAGFTIDDPGGVEDLVTAMLRVRLGEHHEFRVGGVAAELSETRNQIPYAL